MLTFDYGLLRLRRTMSDLGKKSNGVGDFCCIAHGVSCCSDGICLCEVWRMGGCHLLVHSLRAAKKPSTHSRNACSSPHHRAEKPDQQD